MIPKEQFVSETASLAVKDDTINIINISCNKSDYCESKPALCHRQQEQVWQCNFLSECVCRIINQEFIFQYQLSIDKEVNTDKRKYLACRIDCLAGQEANLT